MRVLALKQQLAQVTELLSGAGIASRALKGSAVAQLTFAPTPSHDMTATGFHSLLVRSGDRLRELG